MATRRPGFCALGGARSERITFSTLDTPKENGLRSLARAWESREPMVSRMKYGPAPWSRRQGKGTRKKEEVVYMKEIY